MLAYAGSSLSLVKMGPIIWQGPHLHMCSAHTTLVSHRSTVHRSMHAHPCTEAASTCILLLHFLLQHLRVC